MTPPSLHTCTYIRGYFCWFTFQCREMQILALAMLAISLFLGIGGTKSFLSHQQLLMGPWMSRSSSATCVSRSTRNIHLRTLNIAHHRRMPPLVLFRRDNIRSLGTGASQDPAIIAIHVRSVIHHNRKDNTTRSKPSYVPQRKCFPPMAI